MSYYIQCSRETERETERERETDRQTDGRISMVNAHELEDLTV